MTPPQPDPDGDGASPVWLSTLLVIAAAVGFGLVPFFAKSLIEDGMAPPAIAFFRYVLTAGASLAFLRLGRAERRLTLMGIAAGIGMGIGWMGYLAALRTIPVATVGVLYMTYPVFTIVIAWLWIGDRLALRAVIGALLIVAAAAMVSTPKALGDADWLGLVFAMAAPLAFGAAIVVLTSRLTPLPPPSRMASVSLGAMLGVTPIVLTLDPEQAIPATAAGWGLVLGIGLVTALIPQFIYSIHAPRIGAARAAMAGAVELPTMFVVGWMLLGESVGPVQAAAGAMVLTAIAITPARRARNVAGNLAARQRHGKSR